MAHKFCAPALFAFFVGIVISNIAYGQSAIENALNYNKIQQEFVSQARILGINLIRGDEDDHKEIIERARRNPALKEALIKGRDSGVSIYVIKSYRRKNRYGDRWVQINLLKSDDEIITFLCGENPCPPREPSGKE